MAIYQFTLVVKLPKRALEPQAYVDAWISADCQDATVGTVSPGQIELIFRRSAMDERWAVRSAIDDFTRVAGIVRHKARRRKETYEFEVLMAEVKIGDATYEIADNKLERDAQPLPVTQEMMDRLEDLVGPVEEIDIDLDKPIEDDGHS